MKSDKYIKYVKEIISEYPRIDTIIQSLEMKKDISNNRDVNSFIRSKNKINRTTEIQAINSVNIDEQIESYRKWQELVNNELEEIKTTDNDVYKVVKSKFAGATFDNIENETFIGRQRAIKLYYDFVVNITLLAVNNKLIKL